MRCIIMKILGVAVVVAPLVFLIGTLYYVRPQYSEVTIGALALVGVTLVYFLVFRGPAFYRLVPIGHRAFRPKTSLTWGKLAEDWLAQEESTRKNMSLLREGLCKGVAKPEHTDDAIR